MTEHPADRADRLHQRDGIVGARGKGSHLQEEAAGGHDHDQADDEEPPIRTTQALSPTSGRGTDAIQWLNCVAFCDVVTIRL